MFRIRFFSVKAQGFETEMDIDAVKSLCPIRWKGKKGGESFSYFQIMVVKR